MMMKFQGAAGEVARKRAALVAIALLVPVAVLGAAGGQHGRRSALQIVSGPQGTAHGTPGASPSGDSPSADASALPADAPNEPVSVPSSAVAPPTTTPVGALYHISIPELHISLPVVPGDGINAPLYKAALVPYLSAPGLFGRSVIYAHARPGMFGPLFNAKVGQAIEVQTPAGLTLHYVIRQYFSKWPVNDGKWLEQGDHDQLVLVTCTTYDPNDPRIVVVAERA